MTVAATRHSLELDLAVVTAAIAVFGPAVGGDPEALRQGVFACFPTQVELVFRIGEESVDRVKAGFDAAIELVGAAGGVDADLDALEFDFYVVLVAESDTKVGVGLAVR